MLKTAMMAILVCLMFTTLAMAECVVSRSTIMYFDAPRFYRVAQICAVNQEQCTQMMMVDVAAGLAVVVEPGTKLDAAIPVPDNKLVVVCRIGGVLMLGLAESVKCR